MGKKGVLGVGILLVVLIVLGGILYYMYTNQDENENINEDNSVQEGESIDLEGFHLEYDYLGESKWRYQVTGTLPNPCYTIKTESIVMESYPEQVIVKSTVGKPSEDMICAQVIQEVYEEGEFEASQEAVVRFEIE